MDLKKILIIKFGAIGDIVHSTIISEAIKNKHKDCQIHYLTRGIYAPMLENCPSIDKRIVFNNKLWQTAKELKTEKYDLVIGLSYSIKIILLAHLIQPKKIVFKGNKGTSWIENYFYTAQKVIKDIELPDRLVFKNDNAAKTRILAELNKYPKPHIIVNPGRDTNNARDGRIWSIQKWKELIEKIHNIYGGTTFVTGTKYETHFHKPLENTSTIILSGKYNLKDSCEVLSLADLVISVDSGPIHIASAYNVPTLAILGSTSPDKIKPYGKNGYYIGPKTKCKYCWKKKCPKLKENEIFTPCIESIEPKDVLDKIVNLYLLK